MVRAWRSAEPFRLLDGRASDTAAQPSLRWQDPHRVELLPALQDLEVEMGRCRVAAVPDPADEIALLHSVPLAHVPPREVTIPRCQPAGVPDLDPAAERLAYRAHRDDTVLGREDGRHEPRFCEVDALVHLRLAAQRSNSEPRGDLPGDGPDEPGPREARGRGLERDRPVDRRAAADQCEDAEECEEGGALGRSNALRYETLPHALFLRPS